MNDAWQSIVDNEFMSFDRQYEADDAFKAAADYFGAQSLEEKLLRRWNSLAGLMKS